MDLTEIVGSAKANGAVLPCEIYVDEEGNWSYQGNEITREDILELFYENLVLTADGKFLIIWKGQQCALEAADTPFVISRVDRSASAEDSREEIFLKLKHVSLQEPLDPSTLAVGEGNVLHCRIRDGQFPARFSRPAYYQLAQWIREDAEKGKFYIELNGKRYVIAAA